MKHGAAILAVVAVLAVGCGGPPQGGEGADGADTTADAAARPDTAAAGRFFVRVAGDTDPGALARRHGIRPDTVYMEKARAFVARLTWGEVDALRADSLVRSLAQQIEGPDGDRPEPRGVPVSDTGRS